MRDYVVLLADNDPADRQSWSTLLSDAGYNVALASSPEEARRVLQGTAVDIAVLDVKLKDDRPEDRSGLDLATDQAFRGIPKIMLTTHDVSFEDLRDILGFKVDRLPPAVAFVNKKEGSEKLLQVLRDALEAWPRLRMSTAKASEQTKADYEVARHQARLNYRTALAVSIIGFLVIFAGICLAWSDRLTIGIVGTTTGLITEALSYLFFRRVDLANSRMDTYHRELLESYWLESLVDLCQQLPSGRRILCTERIIQAGTDR